MHIPDPLCVRCIWVFLFDVKIFGQLLQYAHETFILLTKLTFDGSPLYRNTGYEVVAHYKCSDKFDESAE